MSLGGRKFVNGSLEYNNKNEFRKVINVSCITVSVNLLRLQNQLRVLLYFKFLEKAIFLLFVRFYPSAKQRRPFSQLNLLVIGKRI